MPVYGLKNLIDMNIMKCFTLTVLLFLIACKPKNLPTYTTYSDQQVVVKLSHMTTKQDLYMIEKNLNILGFRMNTEGSEFFDDGNLRILKLIITTPTGKTGQTTADLVNLQFKYWGFYYKNLDGSEAFKIGDMTDVLE